MGLLDVNALVALAWDAHVHHEAAAAVARRAGLALVTFDAGLGALAGGDGVELVRR